MVDNAHVDLGRMQAQLTVRPALKLPPELDGIAAGVVRFAVFGRQDGKTDWIGLTGPLSRTTASAWIAQQTPSPVAFGDSFMAVAALAAAGVGRTVLPDYLAALWPGLVCLARPDAIAPVPVWVGAHVDFARSGRIRRVRSHLADALAKSDALKP